MSEVLRTSWNCFDEKYAKDYLHYFPRTLHDDFVDFVFGAMNVEEPSILDVGCGNCRMVSILNERKKKYRYTGMDFSKPLLAESRKSFLESIDNSLNVSVDLVDGDITNKDSYGGRYDISLLSHIVELVDSPESLIANASSVSDYVAIVWYEYPRFEHSTFEVRPFVNTDNEDKNVFSPYLRNKLSLKYMNMIIDNNSLSLVHEKKTSEKDVLTIFKTNK